MPTAIPKADYDALLAVIARFEPIADPTLVLRRLDDSNLIAEPSYNGPGKCSMRVAGRPNFYSDSPIAPTPFAALTEVESIQGEYTVELEIPNAPIATAKFYVATGESGSLIVSTEPIPATAKIAVAPGTGYLGLLLDPTGSYFGSWNNYGSTVIVTYEIYEDVTPRYLVWQGSGALPNYDISLGSTAGISTAGSYSARITMKNIYGEIVFAEAPFQIVANDDGGLSLLLV